MDNKNVSYERLGCILKTYVDIEHNKKALETLRNTTIERKSVAFPMKPRKKGESAADINRGRIAEGYRLTNDISHVLSSILLGVIFIACIVGAFVYVLYTGKGISTSLAILSAVKVAAIILIVGALLDLFVCIISSGEGYNTHIMSEQEMKLHDARREKIFADEMTQYEEKVRTASRLQAKYDREYKLQTDTRNNELSALTVTIRKNNEFLEKLYAASNIPSEHRNVYCVLKLRSFISSGAADTMGQAEKMLFEHIDRRAIVNAISNLEHNLCGVIRNEFCGLRDELRDYVDRTDKLTNQMVNSMEDYFESINQSNKTLVDTTTKLLTEQKKTMEGSQYLYNTALLGDSRIDVKDINAALRKLNGN